MHSGRPGYPNASSLVEQGGRVSTDTDDTGELVHLDVADGVATVTLDSPANRNALSRRLVTDLSSQLGAAAGDESVRVVLLRSSGRVFCSGADMSEAVEEGMEKGARALVALQRQIVALPVPVVVRLDGPVRAGGLGLVGAADVAIAADTVSFALTEVRLGLAPAVISLTVLPRMTSRGAAATALSGAEFDATQAVSAGLVTKAVPEAELDAAVEAVLGGFRQATRQGLRETKALLNAALLARIDQLGEEMARTSAALFASDEARAAMRAFLASR
ncbi:MAG: enoyl-CoA hydratase/isomerase family protein [Nocardioidaceae bacterium]|nr:enoyl-CoA hydratase/isomerase family protein [Nocardioidaceae bacterium]